MLVCPHCHAQFTVPSTYRYMIEAGVYFLCMRCAGLSKYYDTNPPLKTWCLIKPTQSEFDGITHTYEMFLARQARILFIEKLKAE